MNESTDFSADFVNELHVFSLYPVISLLSRNTNTFATLIDNFMCDFSLLPAHSCVIKADLSDNYLIANFQQNCNSPDIFKSQNFTCKCKNEFTHWLQMADWTYLYTINDVDKAFRYFIKKLKRIYNKYFSFHEVKIRNKNPPWLMPDISKSVKYKNKLYKQFKSNSALKLVYTTYKNRLCKIIRDAKAEYHRSILMLCKQFL